MAENSKIEWTTSTFNPWWGCVRVSPGCEHCYAEAFDKRVGGAHWGVKNGRRFFGDKHWREPLKWNAAAKAAGERHRVFCASMADVFEDREELESPREALLQLIRNTPHLDWLLLTKRPENITRLLDRALFLCNDGITPELAQWLCDWLNADRLPHNVWLGTTVENQEYADKRIPELLKVPAVVRFLSCEPLLSEIVIDDLTPGRRCLQCNDWFGLTNDVRLCPSCDVRLVDEVPPIQTGIHWAILGCESGGHRRRAPLSAYRSLRDQCEAAGVACFVKQLEINGKVTGDVELFPEDLRVREFPQVEVSQNQSAAATVELTRQFPYRPRPLAHSERKEAKP